MMMAETEVFGRATGVLCPECNHALDVAHNLEIGQIVTCPDCWAKLEIISLYPLQLKWQIRQLFDDENGFYRFDQAVNEDTKANKIIPLCPDCHHPLDLGPSLDVGQIIRCPDCWVDIEVVSLVPLKLNWQPEDGPDLEEKAMNDHSIIQFEHFEQTSWHMDNFMDDDPFWDVIEDW